MNRASPLLLFAAASVLVTSCAGPGASSARPGASASSAAVPQPAWATKLEHGISSDMRVDLSASKNPNANTLVRITLLITATGAIRNQSGQSLQAGQEKGLIVLWCKSDAKPGHRSFPWPRDLFKGRSLSGSLAIDDYSNFSLMNGNRVIRFMENSVLAVCSNPLTATVDGQSHRCVVVTHGFRMTGDESNAAVEKRTFTGGQTTVWPLDRAFLQSMSQGTKPGCALHEAAESVLLLCK
jgi:hypothetical protein